MTTNKKIGVYRITNITTGKFYIGSSKNIAHRWKQHRKDLRQGEHENGYLQNAWNKYGEDKFEFSITHKARSKDHALTIEQEELSKNYGKDCCYNLSERVEGVDYELVKELRRLDKDLYLAEFGTIENYYKGWQNAEGHEPSGHKG